MPTGGSCTSVSATPEQGEQKDSRRLNPQRLDTLAGKILRIIPDLGEHTPTSTVSENGRYRIPNDNPFSTVEGARKEIWAYGPRNPHRLVWDIDPARPREPVLLAFNIGLAAWETVSSSTRARTTAIRCAKARRRCRWTGMGPIPQDDTIPVQISDTVARGTVKPTYPVIAVSAHGGERRRRHRRRLHLSRQKVPALQGKLVFGDITTGRIWDAERADVLARRRWQPGDRGEGPGAGRRPSPHRRRDLPRARRQGRGAARRGGRLRPRPRRPAVRRRQPGRALHPDEERRHDQEGRRRDGDVTDGAGASASRSRSRARARTSGIRTPPG